MNDIKKPRGPDRLPGDPTAEQIVEKILRVDHAGEYGAVRIYEGQMAVLGNTTIASTIKDMLEQEKEHLATFKNLIMEQRVRPTALLPLWHAAGFALGAATALMGERAAMACTVAIEETIDEHYADQITALAPYKEHRNLQNICAQFREEELEHRVIGLEHGAENVQGYEALRATIKAGSKLAIWLSARI
ncbi:MAG: demethoxyubiquinone hydroxylase family protein [Magnetovibrio sp.]|nr:demethoxyubiquinone hydroxylase family protein [Magnetovibrio sp.]|tara:strand:- start:432 stop:1001 length:570 start_codon:yes stop_codon:yes gene_type:complete